MGSKLNSLGERNLQKSHRIIYHILCDMGLPCSKLNNSNLIKDGNIIIAVSKRYINILFAVSKRYINIL